MKLEIQHVRVLPQSKTVACASMCGETVETFHAGASKAALLPRFVDIVQSLNQVLCQVLVQDLGFTATGMSFKVILEQLRIMTRDMLH